MKTIQIPFAGFYESMWSAISDYYIEHTVEDWPERDESNDVPEVLRLKSENVEMFFDYLDSKSFEEDTAKAYAESFCEMVGIRGKFLEMLSPRYYNFETDRIFIEVPDKTALTMWRRVKRDRAALAKRIAERHTSVSGFRSFYKSDLESWLAKDWQEFDHNEWQTILEVYLTLEGFDRRELESDIFDEINESVNGNCTLDGYVDWQKFDEYVRESRRGAYEAIEDGEVKNRLWQDHTALMLELYPAGPDFDMTNSPVYRCPLTADLFDEAR